VKVDPLPTTLLTSILPPYACAIEFAMARPKPLLDTWSSSSSAYRAVATKQRPLFALLVILKKAYAELAAVAALLKGE
jgi:hypothetical protein